MTTIALPIEFSTRPTTEGDQQAIADLLIAQERHFYGTSHISTPPGVPTALTCERDSLLVLAPGGQIVGYAMIYRAPDEPQTIIASPVIHPNFQGLGLGASLNDWAQQRAQQITATLPSEKSASCSSPGSKISIGWLTTCSPAGASRLSATSGIWRST